MVTQRIANPFIPVRFWAWPPRDVKMNKKLIKIASNLRNFHSIDNYTHKHKLKSKLCGDEIHVYLIVKNNKLMNFKYETKSCIYCQASASLLSRVSINKETQKLKQDLFLRQRPESNRDTRICNPLRNHSATLPYK